jgi:hypothetical protein
MKSVVIFSKAIYELFPYNEAKVITTNSSLNVLGFEQKVISRYEMCRILDVSISKHCDVAIYGSIFDEMICPDYDDNVSRLLIDKISPSLIVSETHKIPEFMKLILGSRCIFVDIDTYGGEKQNTDKNYKKVILNDCRNIIKVIAN